MREAGADILFVEAPVGVDELARVAALPVPQVVNIVFGGRTPMLARSELQEMGFSLVLYANAALQATIKSVSSVLGHLRDNGSLKGAESQLAGFEERQRVVHKAQFDALEKRYAVP
jgi:2-methylisocitrate lyase-like PEP mutase family enzyme